MDDGEEEEFEEIEMGELDDLRAYMVIDKDTGRAYDSRKDTHI